MIAETEQHLIGEQATIFDAIGQINRFSRAQHLVLFVVDGERRVVGSVADGDIRRALLKGCAVTDSITRAMSRQFHYLTDLRDYRKFAAFKEQLLEIVPYVDAQMHFIDVINLKELAALLPVDAVIMAGGKGVRLRPYTNDRPKPLLELNGKPILAHNIDRLRTFGVRNFYISVNHLKEQIIDYCTEHYNNVSGVKIQFLEEMTPMGTLGSVALGKKYSHDDLLVMNADLLTNIDFAAFFTDYRDKNYDMGVATFNLKMDVPYAVLETEGSLIKSFVEKPTYVYYSNAGIYLFRREYVSLIAEKEKYDAIDLIAELVNCKKKVGHFPIRGYWLDIGTAQNYAKAKEDVNYINFR